MWGAKRLLLKMQACCPLFFILKYGHNALHKIFIKKVLFCSIKAPAVFSFSAEKLKGHSHDWLLLTTLLLTHEPVDLRMSMVQTGPACVPSSLM